MAFEVDSNALTSLDSVKRHIGLTGLDDDAFLKTLINQISARIETETQRRFKARDWRFWLSPDRTRSIVLPQYPVIYVTRVASGSKDAISVDYTGSDIRATVQVFRDEEGGTGGIRLVSYDATGSQTATNLTVASNASASAMVTAIDAVSGWDATLAENTLSADLFPTGGIDAKNSTAKLAYPDDDDSTYRVDYDSGIIKLVEDDDFRWPTALKVTSTFQGFLVEARCGYEAIPADIQWIANDLVSQAFKARPLNTNLTSESLGDYSYTLASRVQIGDDHREKLSHYTRLAMGGAA